MNNPKDGFIKRRLRGVIFSFKGIKILVKTEDSIKAQLFIGLFAIILGFIFNISLLEWIAQLIVSGLVLVAESLNTAIEKIANFLHPDYHKKIGIIKDVAAGALLIFINILSLHAEINTLNGKNNHKKKD